MFAAIYRAVLTPCQTGGDDLADTHLQAADSKPEKIEAALRALGKRIVITFEDAA